ncbi:hypothetical protein G6F47_008650 [Rhizopus delemar]|nr:hypothetical protein G6F49_008795 [Rhizopus delemar]KAG1594930.1 hypothetical protein G6F47_008650 [Rhizopus delemar]
MTSTCLMIKEVKPPTSNLMDLLKITLFNATGMLKQSISPILELSQDSDLLFLTETWLLSPTRYKTTWSEYHTYGLPINSSRGRRGHLGLALLVNPQSNLSIYQITHSHPLLSKYSLSIIISNHILIHFLYLPSNLGIDEVTSVLNELPLQHSNTTMTLFCGDFNARLGTYTGNTRFDHRGRIISEWMGSHNLTLWNQRLTYGQPTSYTFQETSIIDLFFSNVDLVSPSLTIRHDLSLFSNHKLMTLSFALPPSSRVQLPPKRTIWNLRKLKQQQTRDSYRDLFTEKLKIILPHHSSLNFPNRSVACQYIDTIHQQLSREEWLRDFWTPALTAAFQRKEHYYRKWRKAHGLNALRLWVLHQEAQATLRRLILKRRRETWRCFCDQMAQGDYTKAIAKFSRIGKNRAIKPSFSTPEGPQHAAEIMAQHLEHIFAGDPLPHSAHKQ